jgi:hypothetical protein
MVGQASSLSIKDDGQDAHPTGNLSGQRARLLRYARNGSLFRPLTDGVREKAVGP